MSHSPPSDSIGTTCLRCGARLYFSLQQAGKTVRCSECHTPVTIPQPVAPAPTVPPAVESYAIRADAASAENTAKHSSPPNSLDTIPLTCPVCGALRRVSQEFAGKQTHCAECGEIMRIPPPLPATGQGFASAGSPAAAGGIPPASSPEGFRPLQKSYPGSVPPKPPRYTFFSGVFTIAWRGEAKLRWFLFSIGLSITIWAGSWLLELILRGAMLEVVAGGFLFMGLFWLALWTFSYGAANCLAILGQTANGGDEIESWPDDDWRDWIYQLLVLSLPLGLSIAAGWLLGMALAPLTGSPVLVSAVAAGAVFPVVLLSSFVAGSPFQPYSPTVWKSLGGNAADWLLVYGLSAALMLPAGLLMAIAPWTGRGLAVALASPYVAAASFVYARLLGRLLWKIHQEAQNN